MKNIKYRYEKTAYMMIFPAVFFLTVFGFWPLVMAVINSFKDSYTDVFVGFENYKYILSSKDYIQSFLNVIILTAVISVLQILLSYVFASLVKSATKRVSLVARILVYIPCLFSTYIVAIMFRFITNFGGGLITSILYELGKEPINFLVDGIWPYLMVILPTIWLGFGYYTLVFYSAIINIPVSYYEAASLDGANGFQKLWYITLPNLKNYFVLVIINLVTGGLQMVDIPMFTTNGGPLNKTMTPALYMINTVRGSSPYYVIVAGALLMMVIILAINSVVLKLIRSEKSMDE